MQELLLQELDVLAWELRIRDGPDAAMPRNLKKQLEKSKKGKVAHVQPPPPNEHTLEAEIQTLRAHDSFALTDVSAGMSLNMQRGLWHSAVSQISLCCLQTA